MKKEEGYFKSRSENEISGNEVLNTSKERKSGANVKYRCPMKCHGEEVYDEPGICPDSKMQMIPVNAGHIFY